MTAKRPPDLSAEEYRAACEELVRLWDSLPNAIEVRNRDDSSARVLYGLAVHVVSSVRSVLLLIEAERSRDSYPLVRKALEFAVMAQWLRYHGAAGLSAFGFESTRRSRAILKTMTDADIEVPADIVAGYSIDVPKVAEADLVRNFEQVCTFFRGGAGLYFMYRFLSADCHPRERWGKAPIGHWGLRSDRSK